jgi:hypothetical protein
MAFDDKKVDTSAVYDSNGVIIFLCKSRRLS